MTLMSWPDVEAYLERSTGVLVPIGSTEQHGPNGLLGTDAICPETVARLVGKYQIDVRLHKNVAVEVTLEIVNSDPNAPTMTEAMAAAPAAKDDAKDEKPAKAEKAEKGEKSEKSDKQPKKTQKA
jgi:hypothetical protein